MLTLTFANLSVVHGQPAQSLGTLFFSPAERDAIVRGRSGPEEQLQAPSTVSVSGILRREGGKSVALVNGQAFEEGQSLYPGMQLRIQQGYVIIRNDKVRPGETLNLSATERTDTLNRGVVIRKGYE